MRVLVSRDLSGEIKMSPETLFDPLCNIQSVGVEKGKCFLYDEGFNKKIYDIELPYRDQIYPSDLIGVHDGTLGESFVGRVTSHSINIVQTDGAISIDSALTVERSEEIT